MLLRKRLMSVRERKGKEGERGQRVDSRCSFENNTTTLSPSIKHTVLTQVVVGDEYGVILGPEEDSRSDPG